MQGYILNIVRVREEDLLVTLLTQNRLKTVYRFYGARHASINLGYKIDFEIHKSLKSTIGMLREVLHLSTPWLADFQKFYLWQQFIKLLYQHLRDVETVDPFYYEMLDTTSHRFLRQNPKRCIVESYVSLLRHEGRLQSDFLCFLCNTPIEEEPILARGFLPAHRRCLSGTVLSKQKLEILFEEGHTLFFSDAEIDILWKIIEEGL
ncbi:MAG TPA: recombination protein RecO [Campylobacteraceae bacterium]|jgi:recombinational DNA repair protein (RecF pathway)|nr:recombination protein RecO [Campylobacteraceae bacterium]